MDVGLASVVAGLLLQADLACIVCHYDPAVGWVPFAGAGAAAGAAGAAASGLPPIPVPPGTRQAEAPYGPRGNAPPNPHDRQGMSREERALADEWEQVRASNTSRMNHPEQWETTAGPPEPGMREEAVETFWDSFWTLGGLSPR